MHWLRTSIGWMLLAGLAPIALAADTAPPEKEDPAMSIEVTSSAFQAGAKIPARYTGDGEDLSPPLSFENIPEGARQLALICDDPDAPTPQPWVHWVLYGISPKTTSLPAGLPSDQQRFGNNALLGKNSWNSVGYRGPAPPRGHGVHHYHFKLYALDDELNLPPGLDKAALLKAIDGHVLAEGELVGTFERK